MKIVIDGNIGCGKSSILQTLGNTLRIPVFLEPIQDWENWLNLFYKCPERWGLSFNLKVLHSFSKWKHNNFLSFYERSPLSNKYIFMQYQKDMGQINNDEYLLYEDIYEELSWTPDLIIYIQTDPTVCMERIQKRNRSCENDIELQYIKSLHEKYENFYYFHKTLYNIVVIDGNKSQDLVYNDILNAIKQYMN